MSRLRLVIGESANLGTNKTGGHGSSISYTPAGQTGIERAQAKQEARWARRSGKVTTRRIKPGDMPKKKDPKANSPFRSASTHARPPQQKTGENSPPGENPKSLGKNSENP